MASYATCNVCKETISYTPSKLWKVGYHLQTKHSKNDVAYFPTKTNGENLCRKVGRRKRNMYKTTVETWNCGATELFCPRCKKLAPPLIRRQRNKVARSNFGALCLLGCWPLCFLPFMVGKGNIVNAYCKDCGLFLGTVDKKTGSFQQAQTILSVDVPKMCVDCVCTA